MKMEVSANQVQELRTKTGAGIMDCKKALAESQGDVEKAVEYLRKKGLSAAAKKASRVASEGAVGSYIHGAGKIGVLVEVNCETDFVARNEDFQRFVKDIAMHIAAANPRYVSRSEVSADVVAKEREILEAQLKEEGKNQPADIVAKIVEGRLGKFYKEVCLLEQPYVRESDKSVETVLNEIVSKIGEKIEIRRFVRFQLGEGIEKRSDDFASEVARMASGVN
jgi:elongation factor Ts